MSMLEKRFMHNVHVCTGRERAPKLSVHCSLCGGAKLGPALPCPFLVIFSIRLSR